MEEEVNENHNEKERKFQLCSKDEEIIAYLEYKIRKRKGVKV